jgi:hypothetical protein
MDARALVTALLELTTHDTVSVPRRALEALLVAPGARDDVAPAAVVADLSVGRVGVLLGWKPSTIRQWAERGRFAGAYKLGRVWRIPPAGIVAFQAAAAGRGAGRPARGAPVGSCTPTFDALTAAVSGPSGPRGGRAGRGPA